MALLVPVSLGELIDKITILEIKTEKITRLEALRNIEKELDALRRIRTPDIEPHLVKELKQVNEDIWNFEDEIRMCERDKDFGDSFVGVTRSVHLLNEKRADIKKTINNRYNSDIKEEKSYGYK
jgi:hypothetical protein